MRFIGNRQEPEEHPVELPSYVEPPIIAVEKEQEQLRKLMIDGLTVELREEKE